MTLTDISEALRAAGWSVALDPAGRPALRGTGSPPPDLLAALVPHRAAVLADLQRRAALAEPALRERGVILPSLERLTTPGELYAATVAAARWLASAPPGSDIDLARLVRGYADVATTMAAGAA